MATTIGRINFMVAADASGVITGLNVAEGAIGSWAGRITTMYQSVLAQFQLNPFTQLAQSVIRAGSSAETAQLQFETLLQSAEKAKSVISSLRSLDAKTPLSFDNLQQSAIQLFNVEASVDSLVPMLQMLSAVSLGNNDRFQRMSMAMSQVIGTGRLMGGELKQLREAGFNPLSEIAKRTGETMGQVTARMEAGGVSVREVVKAFEDATGPTGRYYGLNERASQSLEGRWNALTNSVQLLAVGIGEKLLPMMKGLTDIGLRTVEWVKTFDAASIKNTVTIGAMTLAFVKGAQAIGAVIRIGGALITTLKGIAIGQSIVNALSGPKGWAVIAAGLLAAGAAGYAVNQAFASIEGSAKAANVEVASTATSVANLFSDATKSATDDVGALKDTLKGINDEIAATQKKFDAMRNRTQSLSRTTGAADRFSTAGFEAVFSGQREGLILRELAKIKEAEQAELRILQERVRSVEQAIKDKEQTKVQEVRI